MPKNGIPQKHRIMNFIKRLQAENQELKNQIREAQEETLEILKYLNSPKFHGAENDYVHVSTDIFKKVDTVKNMLTL